MSDSEHNLHRRGFLGQLAAGATALGLASFPGAERLLAEPEGGAASDFDAALKKIKDRKHKQVFDAPRPNDSLSVIWSWAFLTTINQLGGQDKDAGLLVIFRHEAIPFAMQDKLWAKYKLGELFHITDKTTNAPSVRNIVYQPKPEDMPLPDMALEKVQARGVLFGVCDLAIYVYSTVLAQKTGMKQQDIQQDLEHGLVPGVVLLPSGVWAVNHAQENGFTYCFAG